MEKNNTKKAILIAFLVGVILFVVVDVIVKPCTAVEQEEDRVNRLFCDGALLTFPGNNTLIPDQPFVCNNVTENDVEYDLDSTGTKCVKKSSCITVGLNEFILWVEDNVVLGFILLVLIYVLATLLFIPGSVLTIGAGASFGKIYGVGGGTLIGSLAVLLGANIGANLSFLAGKYLMRETVEGWVSSYKILKAVDRALLKNGFKIVLLLRLSPVIPFNVFNYAMGVLSVSYRDYTIGSLIGMVPGTVAFVLLGALLTSANGGNDVEYDDCEDDEDAALIRIVFLTVGLTSTIVAVVLLGRYAKKELNRILQEDDEVTKNTENNSSSQIAPV